MVRRSLWVAMHSNMQSDYYRRLHLAFARNGNMGGGHGELEPFSGSYYNRSEASDSNSGSHATCVDTAVLHSVG